MCNQKKIQVKVQQLKTGNLIFNHSHFLQLMWIIMVSGLFSMALGPKIRKAPSSHVSDSIQSSIQAYKY